MKPTAVQDDGQRAQSRFAGARPHNILFVLTDQWPAEAFGFRGADIPTPHIDRLAAAGTVFRNAFTTCPLCTPARGTLLTARWPHQTGVTDNYAVGYSRQPSLSLAVPTWIDAAVCQGFHVGYFGKWHLGPLNPETRGAHGHDCRVEAQRRPYDPQTDTFSYQIAQERFEAQARALLRQGRAPFWGDVAQPREVCEPLPVMQSGVRFLEEWAQGDRNRPFFLTVSSAQPHFPHYLPEPYAEIARRRAPGSALPANLGDSCADRPWFHTVPWWPCMDTSVLDEDEWRTVIAYSHAHIMMVDEAIGRILDALARLGLEESTTVVFTSDHGDMAGAHNRFDKGPYFYEEVWRIPLVIRTPDTGAAVQDAFVSLLDTGKTLFRLVNPDDPDAPSRMGRDLQPLTGTGTRPGHWPQQVYGTYELYNGMSFAIRAIRTERYKYVWNPQAINELYDLDADPHEMKNLVMAPQYASLQARLHQQLMDWMAEIGDDLPDRSTSLPPAGTIMAVGAAGP